MTGDEATRRRRAEMTIQHFDSFEGMDDADIEFYRALTPQQRLDMMVELISNVIGTHPASRLDRRYRVVHRKRS